MSRLSTLHDRSRRRGTVAILAAVCLTVLISVVAISVDGAMLRPSKRFAQATADTGALAGASTIVSRVSDGYDTNGKLRQAVMNAITANAAGRSDLTLDANKVTIRISPQTPVEPSATITDAAGNLYEGYVEVIVYFKQKRYFSGIFGSSDDLTVRARAVARGGYQPYRDGILVLDRSSPRALSVHGVGGPMNLTVGGSPTVDIIVNSNVGASPGAASVDGGATVAGVHMTVTGVENTSGGGTWNLPDGITRNAVPTADPL